MLNERMEKALNAQINNEGFSAYLYWSMSAWCLGENLPGCANHFRVKALEELTHTDRFYQFIAQRGGRIELAALEGPQVRWESLEQVFKDALDHERKISANINDLMFLAEEVRDNASRIFLQWFVTEQVEEEAQADALVQQLKLMGGAPGGLYLFDREMAQAVFTPPTTPAT